MSIIQCLDYLTILSKFYTRNLWRFLQPKLQDLAVGSKNKVADFIEILNEFEVETRIQTYRNVNNTGWVYFLELFVKCIQNDDEGFMKIIQVIAEYALEVTTLFNKVYHI